MDEFTVGRTPIVLVQIDQDFCNLTYGVAPCTGANPSNKCFNTRKTCQSEANYDRGSITLTFAKSQSDLPKDQYIIPALVSVSTAPTKINPANGDRDVNPLGQRAVANISFRDFPHSDLLVDKYKSERTYNPLEKGTFWTKWLARNPYYQNRPIRIYEGYLGQAIADMQVRNYLIDTIDGPNNSNTVTIVAKDPLKLTDRAKAQAPSVSTGELNADITNTATSLVIKKAVSGDYPASGTVRIDDEIITYSSITETIISGELFVTLNGLTRATDGSIADQHDVDSGVQVCLRYTNQKVWEIAYDLITNYSKIPASFIDYPAWVLEGETWLFSFDLTTLISEPTGVDDLLQELMSQVLFYIWWDERDQLIKFRVIKPYIQSAPLLTDNSNLIENSITFSTNAKNRISQVWLYYHQKNSAEALDNESNYQRVEVNADLQAESDDFYGESVIRKVFARWIVGENQAYNTVTRLLNSNKDNPKYLKFRLDAKDRSIWTADVVDIENRNMVDFNGNQTIERYIVLSAQEVVSGEVIEYMAQLFSIRGIRFGFYMAVDAPQYIDATPEQILANSAWYAQEDGLMPDGTEGWEYQ